MLWFPRLWASQEALLVKNLPASAGNVRDSGSIPGSGRSPGGRRGHPLQSACLENPHGQRSLAATVHGVAKSWTRLKQLSIFIALPQLQNRMVMVSAPWRFFTEPVKSRAQCSTKVDILSPLQETDKKAEGLEERLATFGGPTVRESRIHTVFSTGGLGEQDVREGVPAGTE